MRTCEYKNCSNPYQAKGLCELHYRRHRKGQDMDAPVRGRVNRTPDGLCSIEGCERPFEGRGFCQTHLDRHKKGRDLHAPIRETRTVYYTRVDGTVWTSSRTPDTHGYITYSKQGSNPREYAKEHRLVMETHLGRTLLSNEEVHHRNGVRDDNRIENLELWSNSQPPGQRVIDKISWAKELLGLYEPDSLA